MRFTLIDQVLDRQADTITAVKAVTSAEEYLADHFPGFAVLPGVMMLETLVQAGRVLCENDRLVLTEVRNVRYSNMVRPGQSLQVHVRLRKKIEQRFELEGVGKVDDQVAVQGRFTLSSLNTEQ